MVKKIIIMVLLFVGALLAAPVFADGNGTPALKSVGVSTLDTSWADDTRAEFDSRCVVFNKGG